MLSWWNALLPRTSHHEPLICLPGQWSGRHCCKTTQAGVGQYGGPVARRTALGRPAGAHAAVPLTAPDCAARVMQGGREPLLSTPVSPRQAPAQALGTIGATLTPVICSQSIWIILLSLNAIGPASSDAYLPNLPDIKRDLHTSSELASLTIQINWIVLGLVNPIIGGLSDTYGRRNITVVSLMIFVVGAVGSAKAQTLEQLMIARVVMGVGQAVSVIASAVIRDLIDDTQERMRITGIFNMLQPLMVRAPSHSTPSPPPFPLARDYELCGTLVCCVDGHGSVCCVMLVTDSGCAQRGRRHRPAGRLARPLLGAGRMGASHVHPGWLLHP